MQNALLYAHEQLCILNIMFRAQYMARCMLKKLSFTQVSVNMHATSHCVPSNHDFLRAELCHKCNPIEVQHEHSAEYLDLCFTEELQI